MARNKSRPRKARASKKNAAAGNANASAASGDMTEDQAPIIEGRPREDKKKTKTNPLEFFQQVRNEGEKVTWTGRNETMISTIMVLIMVAIMVLFFFIVDQGLRFGICNILPIQCA